MVYDEIIKNLQKVPDDKNICPKCGGTGWMMITRDDGRRYATRCDCFKRKRAKQLDRYMQIPSEFIDKSFDDFRVDGVDKSIRMAKEKALKVAEKLDRGLLFYGLSGVGKTHLAIATMKKIVKDKLKVGRYYHWSRLLRQIRYGYSSDELEYTEWMMINDMLENQVILLDEFGSTVRSTEWTQEIADYVISEIYNDGGIILFLTTNCEPGKLEERVGYRIISRLKRMCEFVLMRGEDKR